MMNDQDYIQKLKEINKVLLENATMDFDGQLCSSKDYFRLKIRIDRMRRNIPNELEQVQKINERLEEFIRKNNE